MHALVAGSPGIILLPKACIIRDQSNFGLEGVAGRPVKNGPLTKGLPACAAGFEGFDGQE